MLPIALVKLAIMLRDAALAMPGVVAGVSCPPYGVDGGWAGVVGGRLRAGPAGSKPALL
jgi:hypothetical protein